MHHYLINGDSTTLTPSDVASCDVMIVDPPYSEKVHKSAVSVTGSGGELGFDHLETHGKLFRFVAQSSALVKRWSVIYSDIESTHHFREACQESGATYIRTVAWIRWSMPQLSGDRPPSGREDFANLPRQCGYVRRGAGFRSSSLLRAQPRSQGLERSGQSHEGETILDPCAGSGTVGLACAILGRSYVGFELDPQCFARQRIEAYKATGSRQG